jgi:hypothetical protein
LVFTLFVFGFCVSFFVYVTYIHTGLSDSLFIEFLLKSLILLHEIHFLRHEFDPIILEISFLLLDSLVLLLESLLLLLETLVILRRSRWRRSSGCSASQRQKVVRTNSGSHQESHGSVYILLPPRYRFS